jgi:hypothetical protein
MDRNLTKWIFASVAKHFSPLENLHIATQYRDTSKMKQWYELKIDGPYFSNMNRNFIDLKIEIDLQIFSIQGDYLYNNLELQGKGLELFTNSISIFKLGGGGGDSTKVFCVSLDNKDKHGLDVFNFGMISADRKLIMSDIEGHYKARIRRDFNGY